MDGGLFGTSVSNSTSSPMAAVVSIIFGDGSVVLGLGEFIGQKAERY